MNCREARRVLAEEIHAVPLPQQQAAHAHVATCAACRARVDQFGAAIFSGSEDEIPCAECRARLDAYVEAELGGREAARALPLVHTHLAHCPECAEEHRFLLAGMLGLRDDALPLPAAQARFDTRFAADQPPGARPRRVRRIALPGWLRGWQDALSGPSQWAARGALAGFAVVVLLLFAGLVAYEPSLWLRAQSLAPFNPSLRATAAAELAATETVAASMGRDWVDDLGTPGAPAGLGIAGPLGATATARGDQPARAATATLLAATRRARDRRTDPTARPRLTPTATLTPTVALTLTLAPPAATEPAREEPTAAPEKTAQPAPPTSEPIQPPEPPGGGYPPPAEPDEPYP